MPTPFEQLDFLLEIVPYASVDFSKDYFISSGITRRAFWASLPDSDQNAPFDKLGALREATMDIDQLYFTGHKLRIAQPREWPRFIGFGTYGDIFYLEQKIPVQLAMAVCEQAYYLAYNTAHGHDVDSRLDHQAQGVNSISRVGGQENADLNFARRHRICPPAMMLLRPFLAKTGNLERFYRVPRA